MMSLEGNVTTLLEILYFNFFIYNPFLHGLKSLTALWIDYGSDWPYGRYRGLDNGPKTARQISNGRSGYLRIRSFG